EDPAHGDTLLVHLQHHARRIFDAHAEELLEDEHDELHRRVVVVEHQHLVVRRLLRLWPGTRSDARLDLIEAVVIRSIRHARQIRDHVALRYGSAGKSCKAGLSSIWVKKMAAIPLPGRPPTIAALT